MLISSLQVFSLVSNAYLWWNRRRRKRRRRACLLLCYNMSVFPAWGKVWDKHVSFPKIGKILIATERGSVWLFVWKIKKAFIKFMNAFLVRLAERTGYEPSLSLALSSVTSISQFCLSHFNGVWFGVLYRVDIGFMLFAFVLYLTLDTNTRKWLKNECNGLKNPA